MAGRWIKSVFAFPETTQDEISRLRSILHMVTLWGIPVLMVLVAARVLLGRNLVSNTHILAGFLILLFALSRLALHTDRVHLVARTLLILAWSGLTVLGWTSTGFREGFIIGYLTITLASGLLLGTLEAFFFLSLSIFAIWGVTYTEVTFFNGFDDGRDPYNFAASLTINYFLAWLVLYFIIRTLRVSLDAGDQEIRRRRQAESTLQQQAEYLNALHETTLGIINRLELRPLLESILTRACDLVGTKDALIELVVPDGSGLRLELGLGTPAPYVGRLTQKNEGLTGRVWATGKTQFVDRNSAWEPRELEAPARFHTMIGLPLRSGEEVIGVLALLCAEDSRQIDAGMVSLLERFASLASLAIQNARLYEEVQRELIERRTVQKALRENEEKFRKVFHTSPVAISITTLDEGRLLEANYAYWDLTGLDMGWALGRTFDELKLWNSSEDRGKFVEELKRKKSLYHPDDSFEDRIGNLRHVISFYELVLIGQEECVISMFYDMTEQRRMTDALKQSEAHNRVLLEAIPDMIMELTQDGLIMNMIPPKGMESDMPASHFVNRHIYEVLSETAASQTLFAVDRSLATGHMNVFEFEEKMGVEYRALEARVIPNSSATALMMVRDITQRKWVEREREKLISELEERNKESETLRESLAGIAGTFEFQGIIQQVLDQIRRVIPYDSASVWRVEGDRQKFISGRDLPSAFFEANVEFVTDETNSALPIIEGRVPYVLSGDVQAGLSDFQETPHEYVNSWLAVPLKIRGNIIGIIGLDGRRKHQFNAHHADLAVAFASQVAIALENADLFASLQSELEERKALIRDLEMKNAEAETLRESTAIVAATLEISQTVKRILEQLKRVVQYDSASVWLYQEEKAILVGANGLPPGAGEPGYYTLSEKEPDYGFLEGKEPYILLEDIQASYPMFREPPINYIRGWLAVPLRARGKLTGFISLDSRTPGKFTERDAQLALTFADQVSIALENARLLTDLQSELEERRKLIAELKVKNIESETLRESVAIVTATLEKDEAIDRILEQLMRVVPYDSASVQLVNGNMLEIVSETGFTLSENEAENRFEIDEDEPAYEVLRGTATYALFEDVQLHVPAFTEPPHNRIHAWLAVPLKSKGRVIGIIALDGYQTGQFTERHAQLAATYANQVAIALENARLYSDLQADLAIRQSLISELESKNAELERFTYTVSHDLKSPLFTIRGFLGYLEQDALAGNLERMKSDIQRITDATERMQQLLNELLELSRVGRLRNAPGYVPFEELIREAVALVQGRIMEGGVTVHIDANMPTVYGDRPRLLEILQNLVDNAAKFMGGQPNPRIEVGWQEEEAGRPIFHVRDNGMGIPAEHHDRIFGLFNKLDVKADGTGIGLALVKRIVEVHGGRIWVGSEPGIGSTFYFTLPVSPEQYPLKSEEVENAS